jgi:hypothetical protein
VRAFKLSREAGTGGQRRIDFDDGSGDVWAGSKQQRRISPRRVGSGVDCEQARADTQGAANKNADGAPNAHR